MNVEVNTRICRQNIRDVPVIIAPIKHVHWATLPLGVRILGKERVDPDASLAIDHNADVLAPVSSEVLQDEGRMRLRTGVKLGVIAHRFEVLLDAPFGA